MYNTPQFTLRGKPVDALPACPGIYRFIDKQERVLYIGKSVNLRNRVRTHLSNVKSSSRHRRMVNDSERVDVRPTAGEVGALLLENAAIKTQMPVFNRRQRSLRRMWSFTLNTTKRGFCVPRLQSFAMDQPEILATYGAYSNQSRARKTLESIARQEGLCPLILEIESGPGPCFQRQIGRCEGACVGNESPESHNARLHAAIDTNRLSAWPITGPVLMCEVGANPDIQPAEEWHLLHNWAYLGTFGSLKAAQRGNAESAFMFDRDTYHILRRTLRQHKLPLLCAQSLEPITWPLQTTRP